MAKKTAGTGGEDVQIVKEIEIVYLGETDDDDQGKSKDKGQSKVKNKGKGKGKGSGDKGCCGGAKGERKTQEAPSAAHVVDSGASHDDSLAPKSCAISEHKSLQLLLGALVVFDTTMKGVAVATAVRRGDKRWILPLSIFNTVGILPAIYLSTRK